MDKSHLAKLLSPLITAGLAALGLNLGEEEVGTAVTVVLLAVGAIGSYIASKVPTKKAVEEFGEKAV